MKYFTLLVCGLALSLQINAQSIKTNSPVEPPSKLNPSDLQSDVKQQKSLKAGVVFWEEQFDWGDETSQIGWFLPDGWTLQDPTDIGYNWHWANDTLKGNYTNEPPFMSTSADNGFLALNLDGYNSDIGFYGDYIPVNNSITSPPIDCSNHSSVLVKIEQRFRYWGSGLLQFEVTNDDGIHWAPFDMKMGTLYSETTASAGPREAVNLYLNITDVAAGADAVQFRITWRDSKLYYWVIDDITFMEGWDNDLQMLYYEADYDNGNTDDPEGFFYEVPKTQLSSYDFYSVIRNFGNLEQWGTNMGVKVMKNNQYIWEANTDPYVSYPGITDTLRIEEQFTPEEYGHYQIDIAIESEENDMRPHDNYASIPFIVTDSVFSRCDTTKEISYSTWGSYQVDHEGDYMGTWYTMQADEEINSITAYINQADIEYSIAFSLFGYDEEAEIPYELLTSELVQIDSTILKEHWVTLPLDKDGEGEFLEAGKSYMVAVYFTSPFSFEEGLSSKRYSIGSDRSNYYPSGKCWSYWAVDDAWYGSGTDLFMIKMNLAQNGNMIDGVDLHESSISLGQNYPNPFSNSTIIQITTTQPDDLNLIVRDITGKVVHSELLEDIPAGVNEISFNGSKLEPGAYFYTISGMNIQETKRMTVTR